MLEGAGETLPPFTILVHLILEFVSLTCYAGLVGKQIVVNDYLFMLPRLGHCKELLSLHNYFEKMLSLARDLTFNYTLS